METTQKLFDIIRKLRGDGGCSWDRQQTAETMWKCLVEEVYELEEAIIKENQGHIREELGDVLFQLLFIIEIYQEKKFFGFSDVIDMVASKMVRRHPHVYGDVVVKNKEQLDRQWEAIKADEKKDNGEKKDDSVLDRVPNGMPSLVRALKVSKAVVKQGFDWDDTKQVLATVREELDEYEAALASGNPEERMLEFGDILFTMVNLARFSGFHPETALSRAIAKFEGRYRLMEADLKMQSLKLSELSREQIDQLWDSAKKAYDRKRSKTGNLPFET